ncbi:hypothetical protein Tco_0914105 [Tanacetum coccineum]
MMKTVRKFQTKTKLQLQQERRSLEEDMRLQAEFEEEERHRISGRLQAEERAKYTKAEQARMLVELNQSKKERDKVGLEYPSIAAGSSKRDAEGELDQESSKRQKTGESSELTDEPSQEKLQQVMIIIPEQGMNVEALQTKYLIIDWIIYK